MNALPLALGVTVLLACVAIYLGLWYLLPRRFTGVGSVAAAYDRWTNDQLLERLWGEHIHLGYYGLPPAGGTFARPRPILWKPSPNGAALTSCPQVRAY